MHSANGAVSILVAEDNPADVYLLREALLRGRPSGSIDLTIARDGEEAITRLETWMAGKLDLIVLDLNLPMSDGLEVLRYIRGRPDLSGIPVVIFTSSDSPRDRSQIEDLGANSFLTKPSDLDSFLAVGGTLLSYASETGRAGAA